MASTLPVPTVADSKEKISDPMDPVVPSKEYKWWLENIDHVITPSCRKLPEEYSKIPPEDVRAHIYIRYSWKVWAMRQYPCTGMGRFLDNLLAQSPAYKDIVARLRGGESFVDIGCFLGQELRQLVWDFEGAPADQLHAVEIVNHWDLGYERRTASRWRTEARLLTWEELGHDPEETAFMGRDVLMLEFVVTRE